MLANNYTETTEVNPNEEIRHNQSNIVQTESGYSYFYSTLSEVQTNPSVLEILHNDLKLVDRYIKELFEYTFGSWALKLNKSNYKECIAIAKAEYLNSLECHEAKAVLDEKDLKKYLDKEPPYPSVPLISEEEIYRENLRQIEKFYQAHYQFAHGDGAHNSDECKITTYHKKVEFLNKMETPIANKLLSQISYP